MILQVAGSSKKLSVGSVPIGPMSAGLLIAALVAVQPAFLLPDAFACTGFRTGEPGRFVMGKSYDWNIGWGMVVFNPIGLEKKGLVLGPQDTPATWTSAHASITFDQYGCEMPNGGMNDAGLAIELMILGQTEYPPPDDRPAVNELQFIQHALDNFASVDEMISGAALIRISSVYAEVHYLACDVTGTCAAFEFLKGQMVVSTGNAMPAPTLTNSTYEDSVEYLGQFVGFGGNDPIPQSTASLDRFVRASSLAVEKAGGGIPVAAFSILDSVSQGDFSKWNIVYDLAKRTIHFRTLGSSAIKTISLDQFQPGCESGRWILDIDHAETGDAHAAFVPYTMEANKALIDKSLAGIPGLPDAAKAVLAMYPDSTNCVPSGIEPEPSLELDAGPPDASSGDVGSTAPELRQDVAVSESIEASQHDLHGEMLSAADGPPDGSEPVRSKGGCGASPGPAAPSMPLFLLLVLFLAWPVARRRAAATRTCSR